MKWMERNFTCEAVLVMLTACTMVSYPGGKVDWIRHQNADRLVDCCDQEDAMAVSVVSLYGTCLGRGCSSA